MVAIEKRGRGKWVWICIGIIFLLAFVALLVFPYFATKPLSRDQLEHYLTNLHNLPNPQARRPLRRPLE